MPFGTGRGRLLSLQILQAGLAEGGQIAVVGHEEVIALRQKVRQRRGAQKIVEGRSQPMDRLFLLYQGASRGEGGVPFGLA